MSDQPVLSTTMTKNSLGCTVEQTVYDETYVESVITAPALPYKYDYNQQYDHIKKATEFHKDLNEMGGTPNPIPTCANRLPDGSPSTMMAFLPVFAADISEANPTATFEGECFKEIKFEYTKVSDTQFEVLVTTKHPKSHLCSDDIFFANTEIAHPQMLFFRGKHKLTFNMNTKEAQEDVAYGGIKAFAICDGLMTTIESLWNTFKAFFGGCNLGPCKPGLPFIGKKVPKYMEEANVEFLKEAMGITLEERAITKVEIDPSTIQSGDFFALNRLNGEDPLIMYGTGSHIGHCAMALHIDGELYVVESVDGAYLEIHGI